MIFRGASKQVMKGFLHRAEVLPQLRDERKQWVTRGERVPLLPGGMRSLTSGPQRWCSLCHSRGRP